MTEPGRARPHEGRRVAGDEGAALLEFALVAVLLFTIIFGIIQFGLILNFKQDVTRAAAEGARAGAVAVAASGGTAEDAAETAAVAAMTEAIDGIGGSFSGSTCTPGPAVVGTTVMTDELVCEVEVAPCDQDPDESCVTVALRYPYKESPLFGDIPLISVFFPERVAATSVARIND